MKLGENLVEARFLSRENRFLAKVELNGKETDVHVANSGRLRELLLPGAAVWLSPALREGRKTAYTLVLVGAHGVLVSTDARLPNALVAEALTSEALPGFAAPLNISREAALGDSRLDFMVQDGNGRTYVEVKSVTLVEKGVGLFPDSPTARGARHLDTLAEAAIAGHRAAVVFVVQRPDAQAFATNDAADPVLAESLRRAVNCGVRATAHSCRVTLDEVVLNGALPIVPFDSLSRPRG